VTTKTSTQLVFDLFNRMNSGLQYPLSPTNVVLGAPATNDNGAISKNTKATLTAIGGQGYSGSTTVYYNRVDLADILATGSSNFPLTNQVSSADILALWNAAFNTNLIAADIVVEALPAPAANGSISYTLKANTASPAFIGQAALVLAPAAIPLSTAITTTDMTGLSVSDVTAA
jgi:hypothetical protein